MALSGCCKHFEATNSIAMMPIDFDPIAITMQFKHRNQHVYALKGTIDSTGM